MRRIVNTYYLLLFSNVIRGLMTMRRIGEVEFPFITNRKIVVISWDEMIVSCILCIGKMGDGIRIIIKLNIIFNC